MMGSPEPGPDARTQPSAVDHGELLDVLSDSDRRFVVRLLADRSTPTDLDEVAIRLAAHNRGIETGAVRTDEADRETAGRHTELRDRLDGEYSRERLRLHHVHLPKLDNAGAVDYDATERTVTPTRELAGIRDWLDLPTGEDTDAGRRTE
jgi:hypothetical protein